MANFNVDLPQPQAAGASILRPVDNTMPTAIPKMLGDLASVLAGNIKDKKKEDAEAFKNSVVGEYAKKIDSLNNAVATGQIDPTEAARQARARTSQYVSQYPQFSDELFKMSGGFRTETEYAEAIEEEQAQQELRRQLIKDFTSQGGMLPQGASEKYVTQALEVFQADRRRQEDLKRIHTLTAEARAETAENRAATEFRLKQDTRQLVNNLASDHFTLSTNFVNDVPTRISKGEDPKEVIMSINNYFGNIDSSISTLATQNPESASAVRSLFNQQKEVALSLANGSMDATVGENQLRALSTKLVLTAANNEPDVQGAIALSKIFGGNVPTTMLQNNETGLKIVKLIQDGRLTVDRPSVFGSGSREVMSAVKELGRNAIISNNQEGISELSRLGQEALRQIGEADTTSITPEQMSSVMNYIASPEFRDINVKDGKMDKMIAGNAYRTFEMFYAKNVSQAITNKLQEPFMARGTISDAVDVEFVGSGVVFRTKPFAGEPGSVRAQSQRLAGELNQSQKALNQLIHAGAHLEGHDDYGKYWEENKHIIMPSKFSAPEKPAKESAAPKPTTSSGGSWWENF